MKFHLNMLLTHSFRQDETFRNGKPEHCRAAKLEAMLYMTYINK